MHTEEHRHRHRHQDITLAPLLDLTLFFSSPHSTHTHCSFSSSIPLLFFLVVPYFRLFFFLFRESLYFLNVSTQPRVVGYYKRSFFLFFSFLQYLTHHHPFLHCSFFTSLPPNQTNLIASTPLNHPTERCSNSSLYPPPSFLFFLPFLLISLSLFHALSLC